MNRVAALSMLGEAVDQVSGRHERSRSSASALSPMRAVRRYMVVVAVLQLAVQGSGFVMPTLASTSRPAVGCCCKLSGRGECRCRSSAGEACPMCRRSAGKTIRCGCGGCGRSPSAVLPGPSETIAIVPRVVALRFEQPRAGSPEQALPFVSDFTSVPLTPPPKA
jgi:hypothetical protein